MQELKYKVGDKVRIKSLDWYNENKDEDEYVDAGLIFDDYMSRWCGKTMTILRVNQTYYTMEGSEEKWTDEMIEGLVEDETKPEFKIGNKITNGKTQLTILTITSDKYIVEDNFGECGTLYFNTQDDWKLVEEENINNKWNGLKVELELSKSIVGVSNIESLQGERFMSGFVKAIIPPEGYIFKDENGNEILTNKIILEKKKKEYPKTYEECCYVLGFENTELVFEDDYRNINPPKEQWKRLGLMNQLNKLLVCRDAYWKIAGEEMGLDKPWKPDWEKLSTSTNLEYVIIEKGRFIHSSRILVFPTAEMRDAFYEAFKWLIEECKELLYSDSDHIYEELFEY